MIQHRKPADYVHMPWKNGAGSTTELAIFPADATMDDFAWRISCATVAQSGAFSKFDGIDRSILIRSGQGLRLNSTCITPDSKPYRFKGETPITAELLDGTVLDFNVMTRRATHSHELMVHPINGNALIQAASSRMVLFHAGGDVVWLNLTDAPILQHNDLLIINHEPLQTIQATARQATLYIAHIFESTT